MQMNLDLLIIRPEAASSQPLKLGVSSSLSQSSQPSKFKGFNCESSGKMHYYLHQLHVSSLN
jgi:hypothetical protein